jgi:hypothetical protein
MRIIAAMSAGCIVLILVMCTFIETSTVISGGHKMTIKITSSAFTEGSMIPKRYTCDAEDVSPNLAWTGVSEGNKSLALICDDPDAPMGTWVHWVLFNLPSDINERNFKLPAQFSSVEL